MVKIVANKQDGKILGGFVVGPHATDLISEILGIKVSGGTLNDISNYTTTSFTIGSDW